MQRCLQLAARGRQESRPNPMVGAVLVKDGRIIGEGYHVRCGEAHAEVNAFASVNQSAHGSSDLSDATLYVSLEPCSHYGKTPPCADLIIRKGVRRVVVGCVDSFSKVSGQGIERLRNAGIDVTVGVLEQECRWLNRRFFTFHEQHRPYIILKWAQSADGFLDRNGHTEVFSTPLTQILVHKLRSEEDAILVGRVTEEREHPRLNVRHWAGRSPQKLILSSSTAAAALHSIDEVVAHCIENQLQSLIVEGGRQTLQSFIDRGLYDEIRIETAPVHVGQGTPAPALPANLVPQSTKMLDGNTIEHYLRRE